MSSFLLLLSTLLVVPRSQAQVITVTGIIVDLWCWDDNNKKALDTQASMLTDPGNHKTYCMWDVSFCKESGFAFVYQPTGTGNYELHYLLDAEGNAAAITAMKAYGRNNKYFEFTWSGIPDTATTSDCSPPSNRQWYCDGRPILRTVTLAPTTSQPTSNPTTAQPTFNPTLKPSSDPTVDPSKDPTSAPVTKPPTVTGETRDPTKNPTGSPTRDPTTSVPTSDPTTVMTTIANVCIEGNEASVTAGDLEISAILCADDDMIYIEIEYADYVGDWFGIVLAESMIGNALVYTTGKEDDLTAGLYAYTNTIKSPDGVNRNTDIEWTKVEESMENGIHIIYKAALSDYSDYSLTTSSIPVSYALGAESGGLSIAFHSGGQENGFELVFSSGTGCLVDGTMYDDGDSIEIIGYTCLDDGIGYTGKESVCSDGQVVSNDYSGTCTDVCCQVGDVNTANGAKCMDICDVKLSTGYRNTVTILFAFICLVVSVTIF